MSTVRQPPAVTAARVAGWVLPVAGGLIAALTLAQSAGLLVTVPDDTAIVAGVLTAVLLLALVLPLPAVGIGVATLRALRGRPTARALAWVLAPIAYWFAFAGAISSLQFIANRTAPLAGLAGTAVLLLVLLALIVGVSTVTTALALPSAREHVRIAAEARSLGPPRRRWVVGALLWPATVATLAAAGLWVVVYRRVDGSPEVLVRDDSGVALAAAIFAGLGVVPLLGVILGVALSRRRAWLRTATFVVGVVAVGLGLPAVLFTIAPALELASENWPVPAGVVPLAFTAFGLLAGAYALLMTALTVFGGQAPDWRRTGIN